ncbi:MAG TPA: helix-turn-helix transcriptional regulator [Polyangiales bacterium]|nr:helix-turn-helix transcriptional regulator [Polyangiales bacterium]
MGSDGNDAAPTARLGVAVRGRRRALKLNQAELANLAGVGLAFLYELEHGKPTLRIDKVLAVLNVLGLELHVRDGKRGLSVAEELGP